MIRFYASDLGRQEIYEDLEFFIESHDAELEQNHYLQLRFTKIVEPGTPHDGSCYLVILPKAGPNGRELDDASEIAIPPAVFDAFRQALHDGEVGWGT